MKKNVNGVHRMFIRGKCGVWALNGLFVSNNKPGASRYFSFSDDALEFIEKLYA